MKNFIGYAITIAAILCAISGVGFLEFVAMGYAVFAIIAYLFVAIVLPLAFSASAENLTIEQVNSLKELKQAMKPVRMFLIGLPLTALFWYVIYANIGEALAITGVVGYCFFFMAMLFVKERIKELVNSDVF